MRYADLIVNISQGQLDKTFQYRIPGELSKEIAPGTLVRAPFGTGKRMIRGYVISLSDEPKIDPAKIRDIDSVCDDAFPVESQMIALADWIRRYYGGTMNQALHVVLPVQKKERERLCRTVVFLPTEEEGRRLLIEMIGRKNHSAAKEALLRRLLSDRRLSWEEITKTMGIPAQTIRDFEKKGWAAIESSRSFRNPLPAHLPPSPAVELNRYQREAVRCFADDFEKGIRKTYLLYGVTGSGKTEVYLNMIEQVIKAGQQVIMLIPEIALTYQTQLRFYQRFGDRVSVLHSRLSRGERFDQMERAKTGELDVMIGPRSALFTPFAHLGLIILDEEHEPSYQSESTPRYHARRTALERARLCGASVCLGSATPSVESYSRALAGEYTLLRLPDRAGSMQLPHCQIVDLRKELKSGNRSPFSRQLQSLLSDRLTRHEQSMLFLNRRGYLSSLSCRSCGHVIKCPHCDVPLTLHRDGRLYCHYCGFFEPRPKVCPECGSKHLYGFSAGTEKIEKALLALFPTARVLRMDADTVRRKGDYEQILTDFSAGKADILIGTQMIVKGHDFPNVTLMGILVADLSLNFASYDNSERTFQLLVQAAGRAGRSDRPGEVVLQTYQPDHFAIRAACAQDYESFYCTEIAARKVMHYPPAGHLLQMTVSGMDEKKTEDAACFLAKTARKQEEQRKKTLDGAAADALSVLGPDRSFRKRSDRYFKSVFFKSDSEQRLSEEIARVQNLFLTEMLLRDVSVDFDRDHMS